MPGKSPPEGGDCARHKKEKKSLQESMSFSSHKEEGEGQLGIWKMKKVTDTSPVRVFSYRERGCYWHMFGPGVFPALTGLACFCLVLNHDQSILLRKRLNIRNLYILLRNMTGHSKNDI